MEIKTALGGLDTNYQRNLFEMKICGGRRLVL